MNILIVALYPLERNTSVAMSSFGIIDGLLELGHKVTIVMPYWPTCETSYDQSKIRIIRFKGEPKKPAKNKIAIKIRSHYGLLDVTRGYLKEGKKVIIPQEYFDVVLSLSDPKTSHVFAKRLLRKVNYGRWIQHWGDPLYGDITRNFWMPKWIIKLYESRLIEKADKAVYVTPLTLDAQQKEYPKLSGKMSFVPLPAEMLPVTSGLGDDGKLKISYLGDYCSAFRNIRPLYDACAQSENTFLTIAGHGSGFEKLRNVDILPRVPQSKAIEIENDSDVIACVCNRTGTQIPGKIMYKTSTQKHILVAVDGENKEEIKLYLEQFHRFIICDNTKESILAAIEHIQPVKTEYMVPERLKPINVAKDILK